MDHFDIVSQSLCEVRKHLFYHFFVLVDVLAAFIVNDFFLLVNYIHPKFFLYEINSLVIYIEQIDTNFYLISIDLPFSIDGPTM